jgi:hypothetical protein
MEPHEKDEEEFPLDLVRCVLKRVGLDAPLVTIPDDPGTVTHLNLIGSS